MEETLSQRLYNTIGFINTMRNFANKSKEKKVEIDEDNLTIILQLLMDCKEVVKAGRSVKLILPANSQKMQRL